MLGATLALSYEIEYAYSMYPDIRFRGGCICLLSLQVRPDQIFII